MAGFLDLGIALFVAALSGLLIRRAGLFSFDRLVAPFTQLIGGWRDEGWPRGVQEEDRDSPWGATSTAGKSPPGPTPRVAGLEPKVRVRA